jgi:succinate dehydrogenase / fumarate reductase flavoprotein subunit
MSEPRVTRDCDVLVMGAGGAGMRAAIAAAEAGCTTVVVTKSLLGKAHTVMAEGGIAAGLGNVDPGDSWEVHFADTMLGGQLINNWRMVDLYAREVIDRVYELERWGGLFDRTGDGRIMQRAFGAHSWKRLAHVGDRTGLELIRTCQDRLVHTAGSDVLMECTLTRLLQEPGGRVCGAMGYDRNTGQLVVIRAHAVVLGSGGWGRMYRHTSNSWEGTGDGAAMAYQAGAELQDMEFVQFHPTGMVWPPGARGILVTEGVRGEGGILRNSEGERFMERYDPVKKDLSSRDVVARSIYREVRAGRGSPHGGAFLDIATRLSAAEIHRKLPSMYEQFHALAGVDITREPMEVYPTIHYTMGGVRVDAETGATTVPGLYAAGECAAGLHGANRLGGNSLGDILVFGRRAGEAAAELAHRSPSLASPSEAQIAEEERALLEPLSGGDGRPGENPYELHRALQEAMQDDAGIGRDEESLKRALQAIGELGERSRRMRVGGGRVLNPGWHTCRDVEFMLVVSEAIVRSALERRESRGSQWRFDFPEKDDRLSRVNFVAVRRGTGMAVEERPVALMPDEAVRRLARSRFFDAATLPSHYAGKVGGEAGSREVAAS